MKSRTTKLDSDSLLTLPFAANLDRGLPSGAEPVSSSETQRHESRRHGRRTQPNVIVETEKSGDELRFTKP